MEPVLSTNIENHLNDYILCRRPLPQSEPLLLSRGLRQAAINLQLFCLVDDV